MIVRINETEYQVRPADHGTIALAGMMTMSTGEAVNIPLADGKRIEKVRISEIEQIAAQVLGV